MDILPILLVAQESPRRIVFCLWVAFVHLTVILSLPNENRAILGLTIKMTIADSFIIMKELRGRIPRIVCIKILRMNSSEMTATPMQWMHPNVIRPGPVPIRSFACLILQFLSHLAIKLSLFGLFPEKASLIVFGHIGRVALILHHITAFTQVYAFVTHARHGA